MNKSAKTKLLLVLLIAIALIAVAVSIVVLGGKDHSEPAQTTGGTNASTTAPTTVPSTEGTTASTDPVTMENGLPASTHTGKYVDTYDMGADGWYYTKKSKVDTEKNIDPLLNGKPIVDDLGGGLMYVYSKAT